MRPYSQDIRIRVVRAYQQGAQSQREIARRFNVSLTFVRILLKRYRETGSMAPRKRGSSMSSKIDKESLQLILTLVADDPLLPLSGLCERLAQQRQIRISKATMWRTLRKHKDATRNPTPPLKEHADHSRLPRTANSPL